MHGYEDHATVLNGAEAAETLVLRIGYRGGDFAGYAEQEGQRTVAGELRIALETLLCRPVSITCAGRTDAGVHAIAQHVSLPVSGDELQLDGTRLMRALTALVPYDISVRAIYRAAPAFSARFSAVSRSYRYRVVTGPRPVHAWGYAWWLRKTGKLDLPAMAAAADALVGEHDFSSFCKGAALLHTEGRSTHREVLSLSIADAREYDEELVHIDITANAFLHNMVRVVVGTLVEVGRGARDVAWLAGVLAAHDRRVAGPTAPACGLTLIDVAYPAGSLKLW